MRYRLWLAAIACAIALVIVLTTDTSQTPFSALEAGDIASFSIDGGEAIAAADNPDETESLVEILRGITVYDRHDARGEPFCQATLAMSSGQTIEIAVYAGQIALNGESHIAKKEDCAALAARLAGLTHA
jgi:ABC-type amino acid transport substrate-binding protein